MHLLWHFVKFLGQADRAFQKKIVNFQLSEISDFAFWTPSFTNGNGEIVLKISCNSKGVKGSREYSFSDRRAVFWGQRPMQNPAVKTKFGQIWFQQGHLNIKRRHNFEAGHIIQMISFQWPLILFWNQYMDRINVVLKKHFLLKCSHLNSESADWIFWGCSVETNWCYVCTSLKGRSVPFLCLALLHHNVFPLGRSQRKNGINWGNSQKRRTLTDPLTDRGNCCGI